MPVDSLRHKDKRANIPTEELRDFVAEDEAQPATVSYPGLLYARDPSLDPQLVWKGKDEQDRSPLEVPSVPIYIQEKIHPLALIEEVRASAERPQEPQLSLFSDFNGIPFEEMVDFYQHQQNWTNRLILGDSLMVMTSLAEKEGLKGQVQMIYLDPPYGIKFGSNWQVSTRKRDVRDGRAEDLTRQPEQIKAFRDTWELGIHSYLTYLRDRLIVARDLLTETGSIFVQIGDENVHLVRCLMDEVFGADNFVSLITVWKTSSATSKTLATVNDYLLWYAKNERQIKYRQLYTPKSFGEGEGREYKYVQLADDSRRPMSRRENLRVRGLPLGSRPFRPSPMTSQSASSTTSVPFSFQGESFVPGSGGWKTNAEGFSRLVAAGRVVQRRTSLSYVRFLDDFPVAPTSNLWLDTRWGFDAAERVYAVQTNVRVVQRCLLMTTDPGDLVLDPTCGSGTTAYVAEQWGRRWITIDTSRVALALARTRIMSARYPYYLLADSPEGLEKEAEITGVAPPFPLPPTEHDVRKGFVYKRVPHIMLRDIANNEEIDVIHERWQEKLEPLRAELNRLLGESWEEWEVPREPEESWPAPAKELLARWWELRRQRQEEMDASIARHSAQEILYDQPYEDRRRVRVAGPFTVESLSPHRVLSADVDRPDSERAAQREAAIGQFENTILENLKKAGVQNTVRDERLKFERIEPYPGQWLHAVGEYTDKDGNPRRVALSIGPEHGTVGPEQVKEAAKEAMRGVGFDLLVVLGFAFDAHAGETANEFRPEQGDGFAIAEEKRQYGRLPVLLARINPDLAMGDDLLKKTGAGNLFMVFGEPDLEVHRQEDGRVVVEIKGVDVYDPTTGEIRSSSTDDIACWFIDTDYNQESFFVRHAYFTGADEPYDRLKRALRAEIDEDAWASLYSTVSRPFERPSTGRIAVKVINHYGDEVLQVLEV